MNFDNPTHLGYLALFTTVYVELVVLCVGVALARLDRRSLRSLSF